MALSSGDKLGQWQKAVDQLLAAKELSPTFWFNQNFLGLAYEQQGKIPEAIAEFQAAVALDNDNSETLAGLAHGYAAVGKTAEAQRVLADMKTLAEHGYVSPYSFAVVYAGLGDKEQAFQWLDKALEERSYFMAVYLPTDPRLYLAQIAAVTAVELTHYASILILKN